MSEASIVRKVKKAIAERALLDRTLRKLHEFVPVYWVTDRSLAVKIQQVQNYGTLRRKYLSLIRQMDFNASAMEKSDYIWVCWFQGLDKAPELVKACVRSVQAQFPDKQVVLLTDENIPQYIEFPEHILRKRKQKIIPPAHFSDLLRVALLCKYGGLWVDATVYCTGREQFKEFEDLDLFAYRQMEERDAKMPIQCSSWLIYAKKNHPILVQLRDILWNYWQVENKLKDYFLFHMFFTMVAMEHPEQWKQIPMYNNVSPHVMQKELSDPFTEKRWNQLGKISSFHKLNHHLTYTPQKGSIYEYITALNEVHDDNDR